MTGLTAAQLIRLWEDGRASDRHARAALLAESADASLTGDVPLGARNAALLDLRRATFGDRIGCFFACAACGERLELEVSASALLSALPEPGGRVFEDGEWVIRFRELTTDDVEFASHASDVDAARAMLLERCVVHARRGDADVEAGDLPPDVVERFTVALAAADPAADIVFALDCPQCGAHEDAPLDVPAFLWRELSVQARRLLADVDVLARTYCWSERDILAMSSARRHAYLELAGA
jgi:hypothetical protein